MYFDDRGFFAFLAALMIVSGVVGWAAIECLIWLFHHLVIAVR